MKLEKLSKGRFIKTSIIVLVVISIFGVIFINRSKAKYRVTQSIQIVNGTVNYTNPDFSMLGVKLQSAKGSSSYVSASNNKVPTSGYKLKPLGEGATDSYCTINGTKNNTGITISYENGTVTFKGITDQGTRCYLFFDLQTSSDLLGKYAVNSADEGCPDYVDAPTIASIKFSGSLFCKGIDDFGDTYYFRGNPTNNWVKIGNLYWRIIRFNGNGSIRLIYSGNGSPATSKDATQINKSVYNTQYTNAQYVKYMYDNYATSSTMKQTLDDWYNTNLKSTYGNKMDGEAGFCNDADNGSTSGSTQYFKPLDRMITNKKSTFKCGTEENNKPNLYTTSGGTMGNQKLTNPIGLITADEVMFAGGLPGNSYSNSGYYLYTGNVYWTMSPSDYSSNLGAIMFTVDNEGWLASTQGVYNSWGVRPVINLKADTTFKEGGTGISSNPYVVI